MVPNVTGSLGVTWTRTLRITRLRASAPARPSVKPQASCTSPRLSTSHDTSRRSAPSVMRTPISWVRSVTE